MASLVKFYTDEHVGRAVVHGLRRRGINVVSTPEAGMLGVTDEEHLAYARTAERVIFTQDEDFLALHAQVLSTLGSRTLGRMRRLGTSFAGLCSSAKCCPRRK